MFPKKKKFNTGQVALPGIAERSLLLKQNVLIVENTRKTLLYTTQFSKKTRYPEVTAWCAILINNIY